MRPSPARPGRSARRARPPRRLGRPRAAHFCARAITPAAGSPTITRSPSRKVTRSCARVHIAVEEGLSFPRRAARRLGGAGGFGKDRRSCASVGGRAWAKRASEAGAPGNSPSGWPESSAVCAAWMRPMRPALSARAAICPASCSTVARRLSLASTLPARLDNPAAPCSSLPRRLSAASSLLPRLVSRPCWRLASWSSRPAIASSGSRGRQDRPCVAMSAAPAVAAQGRRSALRAVRGRAWSVSRDRRAAPRWAPDRAAFAFPARRCASPAGEDRAAAAPVAARPWRGAAPGFALAGGGRRFRPGRRRAAGQRRVLPQPDHRAGEDDEPEQVQRGHQQRQPAPGRRRRVGVLVRRPGGVRRRRQRGGSFIAAVRASRPGWAGPRHGWPATAEALMPRLPGAR